MAEIYAISGETITVGLQSCAVCDAAIQCARRIASERRSPVVLDDDGYEWLVGPRGDIRSFTQDLKNLYGWAPEPERQ